MALSPSRKQHLLESEPSATPQPEPDFRVLVEPKDQDAKVHRDNTFADGRPKLRPSKSVDHYTALRADKMVIHRSGCGRVAWDYVITVLCVYSAFEGPFSTARNAEHFARGYDLEKTTVFLSTVAYVSLVVDLCFFVDVILNFFTSFFRTSDEIEVYNLKLIAKQYLKQWFILDVLCCIPFELVYLGVGQNSAVNIVVELLQAFLRILKVFKIIKLTKTFKVGDPSLTLGKLMYVRVSRNQRRILALFIAVLYISHFIACLWVTEVNLTLSTSFTSWSRSYGVGNDWVEEYVAALYWVVQTMTTVGYGDVEPANQLERIIATMVMAVSAMFWGYIVASMASIISSFSAQSENAEQFMEQITHYLKEKGYPKHLALKVQRYYRHFYYKQHATDEVEFMENLSPNLQTEVSDFLLGNMKGQIVATCRIFTELDRRELSLMAMVMKPQFFEAGVLICAHAARLQQMFFVLSGDIFVVSPQSANAPVASIDVPTAVKAYQTCREALVDPLDPAETRSKVAKPSLLRDVEKASKLRWRQLTAGSYFGAYETLTLKPTRLPVLTTSPSDLFTISRRDLDNRFRLHPEVLSTIVNRVSEDHAHCLNVYQEYEVEEADRRVAKEYPTCVYMQETVRHRSEMYCAKLKTADVKKKALLRFASAASLVSRKKSLIRSLTHSCSSRATLAAAIEAAKGSTTDLDEKDEESQAHSETKTRKSNPDTGPRPRMQLKLDLDVAREMEHKRLMQFSTHRILQYVDGEPSEVPSAWTFLELAQKLFQKADTEQNGLVEVEQFVQFLIEYGSLLGIGGFDIGFGGAIGGAMVSQQSLLLARAQSIYSQIDDDSNGMIDESEFLPWVLRTMHKLITTKKAAAIVDLCKVVTTEAPHSSSSGNASARSSASAATPGPLRRLGSRRFSSAAPEPNGGNTPMSRRDSFAHMSMPLTPHSKSFRRQNSTQRLHVDIDLGLGTRTHSRGGSPSRNRERQRRSSKVIAHLETVETSLMQALSKVQSRINAFAAAATNDHLNLHGGEKRSHHKSRPKMRDKSKSKKHIVTEANLVDAVGQAVGHNTVADSTGAGPSARPEPRAAGKHGGVVESDSLRDMLEEM